MSTAQKPNPIQAVAFFDHPSKFRLTRPGARYAVHRDGDARPGAWLPDDEELPDGWTDVFGEDEARALLPFLRARATAGRPAMAPTTADGKLIAKACRKLGLTAVALAKVLDIDPAMLSRARNGELPQKHRDTIRAMLGKG